MSRCSELAKRPDAPEITIDARIKQLYADLDRATELAFDAREFPDDDPASDGEAAPDLQNLAKLLELKAKVFGLIGADGKSRAGDASIPVPLDEAKRLIAAAELRLKEQKNVES